MTSKPNPRCVISGRIALAGCLVASLSLAADIPVAAVSTDVQLGSMLSLPTDVGVGAKGRVYVVDSGNHQVAVFSAKGARIATLGERGSEPGQFEAPVGVGIGPAGEIFVADKGNERLQLFSPDGRFRRAIPLEEDGKKVAPVDVAVSADGKELFVSSNSSHRILVFSDDGKLLRAWGGEGDKPGQFRFPATLAISPDGNVLVVDVLNNRVQKFDPQGDQLATMGEQGGKPGTFYRPKGIALDASGRSYVSDSFLGVVQVFDADGEFLHVIGEAGEVRVFDTPVGMAVDGERLLVVQMLAGNVLLLNLKTSP